MATEAVDPLGFYNPYFVDVPILQGAEKKIKQMNVEGGSVPDLRNAIIPTGVIWMWPTLAAPIGWMLCQGQLLSRTSYGNLFKAIGEKFGAGDGSSTFALPNYKGRVPVGMNGDDSDFVTIGTTGGQKTVQAHLHASGTLQVYANAGDVANGQGNLDDFPGSVGPISGSHVQVGAMEGSTATTGTGTTNMNPYLAVNFIIKY